MFGTADAFWQGMTTLVIEHIERPQPRLRTPEQAARLLAELRQLYKALSRDEQDLVRGRLRTMSKTQKSIESEEF